MLILDYKDARPVYEQIVEKLKLLIENEALTENDKLPSVRQLAIDLSVNPNTVQKAYAELERQGFIYTVKGRGAFVSYDESAKEKRKTEKKDAYLAAARAALSAGVTKRELAESLEALKEPAKKRQGFASETEKEEREEA